MRRQAERSDDDNLPVIVPRNDKALRRTSPDRVRRLHRHLVKTLLSSRASAIQDDPGASGKLEPAGFAGRVVSAACTLCKGSCCKNGDDDAFLGESTMDRVLSANPELELLEVAHLYVERVPDESYEGSCIFHGKQGCTLDRSLRSEVCNNFFCGGLDAYLKGDDHESPVVIFSGEGHEMRTSKVLSP